MGVQVVAILVDIPESGWGQFNLGGVAFRIDLCALFRGVVNLWQQDHTGLGLADDSDVVLFCQVCQFCWFDDV